MKRRAFLGALGVQACIPALLCAVPVSAQQKPADAAAPGVARGAYRVLPPELTCVLRRYDTVGRTRSRVAYRFPSACVQAEPEVATTASDAGSSGSPEPGPDRPETE